MATIDLDYTRVDVQVNKQTGNIELLLWDDKAVTSGEALAVVTLRPSDAARFTVDLWRAQREV